MSGAHGPAPAGSVCELCGEAIAAGEPSFAIPALAANGSTTMTTSHAECLLSSMVGHELGLCSCTRPDASVRELARLVWDQRDRLWGKGGGS